MPLNRNKWGTIFRAAFLLLWHSVWNEKKFTIQFVQNVNLMKIVIYVGFCFCFFFGGRGCFLLIFFILNDNDKPPFLQYQTYLLIVTFQFICVDKFNFHQTLTCLPLCFCFCQIWQRLIYGQGKSQKYFFLQTYWQLMFIVQKSITKY